MSKKFLCVENNFVEEQQIILKCLELVLCELLLITKLVYTLHIYISKIHLICTFSLFVKKDYLYTY